MVEPRFPPPGGQQAGYRDAGKSISDGPRPPELEGPELPRGKRVIATRPDDPDVALAKAFTPPRPRRQQVSRASVALVAIVIIGWIALQLLSGSSPHRRVSPPSVVAPQRP